MSERIQTVKIRVDGNEYNLEGTNFEEILGIVKGLQGRRWVSGEKLWELSLTAYDGLRKTISEGSDLGAIGEIRIVPIDGDLPFSDTIENQAVSEPVKKQVTKPKQAKAMPKPQPKNDAISTTKKSFDLATVEKREGCYVYPAKLSFDELGDAMQQLALSGEISNFLGSKLTPKEFAARVYMTIDHFRGKVAGKIDQWQEDGTVLTKPSSTYGDRGSFTPKEAAELVLYCDSYGILPWQPKSVHSFYFKGLQMMLHYQKVYTWARTVSLASPDGGFIVHLMPYTGGLDDSGNAIGDLKQVAYLRPNSNASMWTTIFTSCMDSGTPLHEAKQEAWEATSTGGEGLMSLDEAYNYKEKENVYVPKNNSKKNWDYITDVLAKRATTKAIFNHYGDLSPNSYKKYFADEVAENSSFSVVEEIKDKEQKKLTFKERVELVHGPEDFEGFE